MIGLSYQLQGADVVEQRLAALAGLRGLDSDLEAVGADVVKVAQQEPAERPGQRYVRSHRLSGSWRRGDARRAGSQVLVDVTNDTPYGLFVRGDDQAEIHRGRWKKLRAIGEEQRGAMRARVQTWAIRVWRGG